MTHQFKAGDSVVCVDDSGAAPDLHNGNIYPVEAWSFGELQINGKWWGKSRFRPAPSPSDQSNQTRRLMTDDARRCSQVPMFEALELSRRVDALESRPSTRAEPSAVGSNEPKVTGGTSKGVGGNSTSVTGGIRLQVWTESDLADRIEKHLSGAML